MSLDLADIADLYTRERETDALQELPAGFFDQVLELLKSIQQDRARADNYRRQEFLDDQFKSIIVCYQGLVDKRASKVFECAAMEAPDNGHMTPAEKTLYTEISKALKAFNESSTSPIDLLIQGAKA